MYNFPSRRERHNEKIRDFLDSAFSSMQLKLYSHEIKKLERDNPEILISKGEECKETPSLYRCTVYKRK